jgi:hypothetical protein
VKHFQGSQREQARGRIVAPHLMLASVRAGVPLAPRRPDVSQEPVQQQLVRCRAHEANADHGKRPSAASLGRGCSAPRGSLYSRARGVVYRLGCGRWKCAPCARRKAAAVRDRFKRILWRREPALVTLTAAMADDADPTPAAMRRFARRVASFRRWVTRHHGRVQWAWVREVAERDPRCVCHEMLACRCGAGGGRLHVHMLWDAPFVPQRALSAAAVRCGLGPVLDVRRVSGRSAAGYVAKYLVKSGQHPAFTRARCRRFAIRAQRAPRAESDWRYDSRRPALVAVEELGCREIDWAAEGWCAYEPRTAGRSAPAG